ncbi:hypothetical protein AB0M61_31465 [Streptomyces sp. NPDC051642]|uniref:hypothetical protein n=1 Tax=Streptomyces sp. NPDC051642 TaxID=3154646 RepID=UPI003419CB06
MLIAVLGAGNVLLVDAATFAVSAPLFAFGVRGLPEAQAQRRAEPVSSGTYRRELAEGYRFLAATPLLLGLCLMTLVTRGLDQGWSAVLLPVHAREELDGTIGLGLLNAAFGIRALTGALVYGAVGSRFRRCPVFTIAFLVVGLPRFVVAASTHTFAPLAVTMAIEGLACGLPRRVGRPALHAADGRRCVSARHAVPGGLPGLEADGQCRLTNDRYT